MLKMSISSLSSQTTLLSVSYVNGNHSEIESRSKLIQKYKEKYTDRNFIYEDWRKNMISSFGSLKQELDTAVKNNRLAIEEAKETLNTVQSEHLNFILNLKVFDDSVDNRKKKRKVEEI
jgi:hypothetical protein